MLKSDQTPVDGLHSFENELWDKTVNTRDKEPEMPLYSDLETLLRVGVMRRIESLGYETYADGAGMYSHPAKFRKKP